MMRSPELVTLVSTILASISSDGFDDDAIEKLRFFFTDNLLFAALDLIDQESVIKYTTPWGRSQYEVLGTTATYAVFPELLPSNLGPSAYCTCPSFTYSVLLSESQFMCKHLLATLLAQRLAKCVERPINADDFAAVIMRQCSS